jgi:hypothetical protein
MTGHQNHCCHCKSTVFVHIPSLPVDMGDGPDVLHLAQKSSWFRTKRYGHIRALVCVVCGRTELYTNDVQRLCELADDTRTGVAVLDFASTRGV